MRDDLSMLVAPSGAKIFRDDEKTEILCDLFEKTYVEAPTVRPSSSAVIVPSDIKLVDDVDVSEASVLSAFSETKATWSTSPEGIPAAFFRRIATGVAKPLSTIYRRSIDEGKVPSLYKTALIAAVHKKGVRADPLNKRPVSLTSVTCRVL